MATTLTGVGFVWAFLSLAAAILCCSGFYLPFWIQGKLMGKVDAYFSSFRRCNYPRVTSQGVVEIVMECGRYSRFWDIPSPWWQASSVMVGAGSALSLLVAVIAISACCITYVVHTASARVAGIIQLMFWDIPSPWWQASTVMVGAGSALSLLVAVTAISACCITYVVHTASARVAGIIQLLAALLVSGGVALYPIGWDNREVRDCCGSSQSYRLGTCQISWSFYLLSVAVLTLLLCFCLSFCASQVKPGCFRS